MSNAALIAEVVKLMESDSFQEAYEKLKPAISDYKGVDLELLWRFACCCRFLSLGMGRREKSEKMALIKEGEAAMKSAVEQYPNEAMSNTWYGVMLSYRSKMEGVNERIKLAYEIRSYFDKGHKADPNNYYTNYCLGSWCYTVADLGKVERVFASTFFSAPPKSTFEEALGYFQAAYKADPNQLLNTALLALTCKKLDNMTEAKKYAEEALKLRARDIEMEEAKEQCKKLVK